jgi:excisionase family DNA binding protein
LKLSDVYCIMGAKASDESTAGEGTVMEELLTTRDVSKLLDVSPEWVRQLERQGRLPALRTRSGQRLFKAVDVDVFAQQRADKQGLADAER